MRNLQSLFHNYCTILSTNSIWVFQFPHPTQHLFSIFLIITNIFNRKWYLIVVLSCIFQMTNDVEHLFLCCWYFLYLQRNVYPNILPNFLFIESMWIKVLHDVVFDVVPTTILLPFANVPNFPSLPSPNIPHQHS